MTTPRFLGVPIAAGGLALLLGLAAVTVIANQPAATATANRQTIKQDRFHWYGLSDKQSAKLTAAAKAVPLAQRLPHREVLVLCNATLDCLDLAQDIVIALERAGWTASVQPPMDAADGLRCTVEWFCGMFEQATGIKSHLDPDEAEQIILNFGHKGR